MCGLHAQSSSFFVWRFDVVVLRKKEEFEFVFLCQFIIISGLVCAVSRERRSTLSFANTFAIGLKWGELL